MSELWMEKYAALAGGQQSHHGHTFLTETLIEIERFLPKQIERSVETGCGKSTILFSNISADHRAFCLDDREMGDNSSVTFFQSCPLSKQENVSFIYGPTQRTLPIYDTHAPYDIVFLDGPHGYPFPELEYVFLYPHLKKGGLLIVDDLHIPTIGRLADFLYEDEMYEPVALVSTTAIFKRTQAETFDPCGDGWWKQKYNRRRVSPKNQAFLNDGPVRDIFSDAKLDQKIHD